MFTTMSPELDPRVDHEKARSRSVLLSHERMETDQSLKVSARASEVAPDALLATESVNVGHHITLSLPHGATGM